MMKRFVLLLSAIGLTAGVGNAQNLLSNPGFEAADTNGVPDSWDVWSWGANGWANRELNGKLSGGPYVAPNSGLVLNGVYDGTYQMAFGAAGNGGGGAFQIVSATAGLTYEVTVQGGADDWWLPTGEIRMFFLDAADVQLDLVTTTTTESIHNPDLYDWGVVYQNWSLIATAPAGTAKVKVEFAEVAGTGSVWFDNASLMVVPEPSVAALVALGSVLLVGYRSRRNDR